VFFIVAGEDVHHQALALPDMERSQD